MSGLAGQDQTEKSQMERLLAEVLSTASGSRSGSELTLDRRERARPRNLARGNLLEPTTCDERTRYKACYNQCPTSSNFS